MIANFQVELPYDLLVLPDQPLQLGYHGDEPLEGVDEFEVLVGPPYRSRLSEVAPNQIAFDPDLFNPADPQPVDTTTTVVDVAPVRCDTIQVQIVASEFDRRDETVQDTIGALLDVVIAAVNGILERLRVLTRSTHMKPLSRDGLLFRVVMLEDAGELVEAEEGKWRQLSTGRFQIRQTAVTPAIWQELVDLGDYRTPPWDELLLDAMDLDVELGPSLVLAATAVETRIANALDLLAKSKLDDDLWAWINERDDDYMKAPALSEQLDQLLESLGGKSLKEDDRLWEASVHLRRARNSFVHEGRAMLGKKNKTPATRTKARELVVQAGEILDFIEALLPEAERRPRLRNEVEVTTTMPFQSSPPEHHAPEAPERG